MSDLRPEIRVARRIEVIEIESLKGKGTEESPAQRNLSYWTLDGIFLAERDGLNSRDVVVL